MQKAAGVIFFAMWIMCGCTVETMMDDWRSCLVVIIALVVCAVTAALMGGEE